MSLERAELETLIFGDAARRRFTQNSPVLPDVWLAFGADDGSAEDEENLPRQDVRRVNLLIEHNRANSVADLSVAIRRCLEEERGTAHHQDWHPTGPQPTGLGQNHSYLTVTVSFDEVVRVLLPLSPWWRRCFSPTPSADGSLWALHPRDLDREEIRQKLVTYISPAKRLEKFHYAATESDRPTPELIWFAQLAGRIEHERLEHRHAKKPRIPRPEDIIDAFASLVASIDAGSESAWGSVLWRINRNRRIRSALTRSVPAIKADAAERLFEVSCRKLVWAVVDSGIDATHEAFSIPGPGSGNGEVNSRVLKTLDFTRLPSLVSIEPTTGTENALRMHHSTRDGYAARGLVPGETPGVFVALGREQRAEASRLRRALRTGEIVDWMTLDPLLAVSHKLPAEGSPRTSDHYQPPADDHGTHVAGILAADWSPDLGHNPAGRCLNSGLRGVCHDIRLFDMRVFNAQGGTEEGVLAALQYIRWLNGRSSTPVIHGVNLSLSLIHDVGNYACGRTPVCDECERLAASGVVVVAAAGNDGYAHIQTSQGIKAGFRSTSISDPGNADQVITVGATHRYKPHTYGVSYFSSRGPTGDGRAKPDIVAPGENILSTTPGNGSAVLDGTSMAAPHVSGAAAMLMARHWELVGQPGRVKQILCDTATDLGRERFFQGAGMLDVLRALQYV